MQNEDGYGIKRERDEVDADSSPPNDASWLSRYSTVIRTDVNVKAEIFGQSLLHSLPDSPGMQDER